MNSALLKRLFRAIQSGSGSDVDALCRKVVEEEKKAGHSRVAEDLELILENTRGKARPQPAASGTLSTLPTSRRDSAPLLQEVPRDQLRHAMVLPASVEKRFHRIEKEFAARTRLAAHGLQPRRRVLLHGPPGCGKSLGAERLAWNTGLPLLKVRFDTLLSSYFGETHSNLRKVFDAAEATPCALFLDECDTLARSRTERNDVGEATRITNALLEMLEGYRGDGLVIAATNLDSSLDTALIRRFDEVLRIPLPATDEIEGILKTTLSAVATEKGLPWVQLAREMDGMSCSEVTQIGRNAAKHAVLEGRKKVTECDLRFALTEIHERHHQAP
jgi:SpoVK/Ycf46/Vps4 family AAA+-type ATPase